MGRKATTTAACHHEARVQFVCLAAHHAMARIYPKCTTTELLRHFGSLCYDEEDEDERFFVERPPLLDFFDLSFFRRLLLRDLDLCLLLLRD